MTRAMKRWTPEEDAKLRDIYLSSIPFSEVAAAMGRTGASVMGRLTAIGLTRPRAMWALAPGYARWTDAQDAAMREMYPAGKSMAEIRAVVCHSDNSIWKRAIQLGVKRPRTRTYVALGERQAVVIQLAARPEGVESTGFGLDVKSGFAILARLKKRGLLFAAVLSPRMHRFFTTQKAADAWSSANLAAYLGRRNAQTTSKGGTRAGWGADAPMVITAETKFTYAPAPVRSLRTNTYA